MSYQLTIAYLSRSRKTNQVNPQPKFKVQLFKTAAEAEYFAEHFNTKYREFLWYSIEKFIAAIDQFFPTF